MRPCNFTLIKELSALSADSQFDNIINNYKKHSKDGKPNVTLIYQKHEAITCIPEEKKQAIQKNALYIEFDAKHEPFNDDDMIRSNFKRLLLGVMDGELDD
jgi:hypothetical protein